MHNSQLALLLPIKDRPEFLNRTLMYLSMQKCPYPIVIADGSFSDCFKSIISRYLLSLNLTYKYYGPDSNYARFIKKMNICVNGLDSKYVMWICDDDFINLDFIPEALSFLEENPTFSMVTGVVRNFNLIGNKTSPHQGIFEIGNTCYSMKESICAPDPVKRMQSFDKLKPFEALHRTEVLKFTFSSSVVSSISHHDQLNIILTLVSMLSGSAKFINKPIVLRQHNTPNSAGSLIPVKGDSLAFFKLNSISDFVNFDLFPIVDSLGDPDYIPSLKYVLLVQILLYLENRIKNQEYPAQYPLLNAYLRFKLITLSFVRKTIHFLTAKSSSNDYQMYDKIFKNALSCFR